MALLGLGFAGATLHLPALRRLGAEVVLAVDPDPAADRSATGLAISRDWRDAMSCGARAVVIATPVEQHTELALAALSAGQHVYVEKPMATTSGEALALTDAARRTRLVLQVGFAYRFHPLWRRLVRLRAGGYLEPPLTIEAQFTQARDGSGWRDPLLDLAVHHIDLATWLLGTPPATVGVNGPRLELAWEGGSSLSGTYGVGPAVDRMRIRAGAHTVELDRVAGWRLHGRVPLRFRLPPPSLARARIASRDWERSFELALRSFLQAAVGLAPPCGAGAEDGAVSVAVVDAVIAARASRLPERVAVTRTAMGVP